MWAWGVAIPPHAKRPPRDGHPHEWTRRVVATTATAVGTITPVEAKRYGPATPTAHRRATLVPGPLAPGNGAAATSMASPRALQLLGPPHDASGCHPAMLTLAAIPAAIMLLHAPEGNQHARTECRSRASDPGWAAPRRCIRILPPQPVKGPQANGRRRLKVAVCHRSVLAGVAPACLQLRLGASLAVRSTDRQDVV